jgi:hypothetical protein
MTGGGFGNVPWGGAWGSTGGPPTDVEHIPNSPIWNAFDLMGVRQPNDMDRVQVFIETTTLGDSIQFFISSFNIRSGGAWPTSPGILDIDLPVTETFTVEWRVNFHDLPPDFSDLILEHILFGVNNASGPCASLMFSGAGIGYTGAFQFAGGTNDLELGHELDPGGATPADKYLYIIPGSDQWFDEDEELYIRLVVDVEAGLVYLFVTAAADITPGTPGVADSSGHVLRALLPILWSWDSTFPTIDRIANSVRGSAADPSTVEFFHYNMGYKALVPNLPPRAIIGPDQAIRLCGIAQLDGSASFDPEGEELVYDWRLIDAPETSQFVFVSTDGRTEPMVPATGFTNQLFSVELALENTANPIQVGDVITVGGVSYTIFSIPPGDTVPFYVTVERPQIPDDLVNASYKLVRQAGISGADTPKPTFYPDVAGFYLFDLRVFDGVLWSTPTGLQRATTIINVLESPLPRACTPNLSFLFDYISDFWQLVEDADQLQVFWGSLAQAAATELYTLWQHDYSKSIRDIQRTFIRRWLHYDTLLAEPVPELTKTFPVFGGVESVAFTTARVNNTRLGLSSTTFDEDKLITFSSLDPIDPVSFTEGFSRYLKQEVHEAMSAHLVETTAGEYIIRIDAPFEFEVNGNTTPPLFTVGDKNEVITGSGYAVEDTTRTFKVDRSLEGLDLAGAFLVLGDISHAVDRVVSDASDDYPFQRVVVQEDLSSTVPTDTALPAQSYVICGWISSELLDFYNGLVTSGDFVDVEVVEENTDLSSLEQFSGVVSTRAYGASETFPSRLPADFGPIGQYAVNAGLKVRLASVLRKGRVPVDELVVDVPVLQERVVLEEDESTLRRNLDFFIEEYRGHNSIRFVSGQNGAPDVFEGERPPDRLWAEYTYLDNNPTIENNFGLAVELTRDQLEELPENVDYLSAVSGLLYVYGLGPTVRNLRIGSQILLGLPFAEEDGTIEEVRKDLLSDQGRILIRDTGNPEIVRSYTFPKILDLEVNPATGERYEVGDTVTRFDPLVEGAEVVDYIKDPNWFQGILNQGVFSEVQKFHTFAIRVDGRAFNLSSLLFVRNFILRIKPTYTYPKFIVTLFASGEDGDEISVNDTIEFKGTLILEDSVCAGRLGSSYIFDQSWPGGGQPWEDSYGVHPGHNRSWRNAFDHDDDPTTSPTYWPLAEETVYWAYDKMWLCPHDDVVVLDCLSFVDGVEPVVDVTTFSGAMMYDTIFAFDQGVTDPNYGDGPILGDAYEGDESSAGFSIPAGTTGYVLTLSDSTANSTGSLKELRLAMLGWTDSTPIPPGAPPPYYYEMTVVVKNVTAATEVTYDFWAHVNTEIVAPINLAVTAGDTIQVSIRKKDLAAVTVEWTRILTRVKSSLTWKFDMGVTDPHYGSIPALPDGDYCGEVRLAGGS